MVGLQFMGAKTKVVICLLGMALMGYFLYSSLQEGLAFDTTTILRAIVFLGFGYFLVKNLQLLLTPPPGPRPSEDEQP